jgi:hypothetical protein
MSGSSLEISGADSSIEIEHSGDEEVVQGGAARMKDARGWCRGIYMLTSFGASQWNYYRARHTHRMHMHLHEMTMQRDSNFTVALCTRQGAHCPN